MLCSFRNLENMKRKRTGSDSSKKKRGRYSRRRSYYRRRRGFKKEKYYKTTAVLTSQVDHGGFGTHLNAIQRGFNRDQRHGDRVMMTGIRIKGKVYFEFNVKGSVPSSTSGSNIQYHYLIYDRDPGNIFPAFTNIFSMAQGDCSTALAAEPVRYQVLKKWTTRLDYYKHWEAAFDKFVKFRRPAKWTAPSTDGDMLTIELGALYYFSINSRESASGCKVNTTFQYRLYWKQMN
ncbi:capsid protein [Utkilio virus]|nr:capsid protein [Utkilio virus]